MIAKLVRLILAAELLAGAAAGYWLARRAGWPPWPAALAGTLLMPVLLHAWTIGIQSLTASWWRRRSQAATLGRAGATPAGPTAIDDRAPGAAPIAGETLSTSAAVRAWLGETAASLRSFFVLLPWLGERALPSGTDPARLPVLLVHGYFCNRSIWRPLARWLAARGHAIESVNLEPPFASVDDYLPAIDEAVDRLSTRTGAAQIGLVGHSLGALAIRRWLSARGADRIAAVVTLGGPHRGTWSANFALGPGIVQMRPDNPWLAKIAASETPRLRRLFTIILTLHDNIVVPQATQTLPDARVVVLAGLGHVQLVHHPSVRPHVAAALDRAMPHAQASADPESGRHAGGAPGGGSNRQALGGAHQQAAAGESQQAAPD